MILSSEIGSIANWSVSSSKESFGVEKLQDNLSTTYWQSDGPQPHRCTLVLKTQIIVTKIKIELDFKSDESYTPSKLLILAGPTFTDMVEVGKKEVKEPQGWIDFDIEYDVYLTRA
jgi:anaphase-promoting complex subunit 10